MNSAIAEPASRSKCSCSKVRLPLVRLLRQLHSLTMSVCANRSLSLLFQRWMEKRARHKCWRCERKKKLWIFLFLFFFLLFSFGNVGSSELKDLWRQSIATVGRRQATAECRLQCTVQRAQNGAEHRNSDSETEKCVFVSIVRNGNSSRYKIQARASRSLLAI